MTGAATGMPRWLLRLEGLAVFIAALIAYRATGAGWGLFALAILAPDLSMLGYLGGPRIGAALYNAAHSYLAPALLAAAGWWLASPLATSLALIWIAHIGFDRALGYGLKYAGGFGLTHLGRVGKAAVDGDRRPGAD